MPATVWEVPAPWTGPTPPQLLEQDDLLGESTAAAAVFFGYRNAEISCRCQFLVQAGMVLFGTVVGQRVALLARAAFLATEIAHGNGEIPLFLGEPHRIHQSSSAERPLASATGTSPAPVGTGGRLKPNGRRGPFDGSTSWLSTLATVYSRGGPGLEPTGIGPSSGSPSPAQITTVYDKSICTEIRSRRSIMKYPRPQESAPRGVVEPDPVNRTRRTCGK